MAKNKSLVCEKLLEKPYLLDLRFTAEQNWKSKLTTEIYHLSFKKISQSVT